MARHVKIKPKRSLASRKRAKDLDASRQGEAFEKGLPEPLRPEVEGCMSRRLRDLLRRVGSLNPEKGAVKLKERAERRAAFQAQRVSEPAGKPGRPAAKGANAAQPQPQSRDQPAAGGKGNGGAPKPMPAAAGKRRRDESDAPAANASVKPKLSRGEAPRQPREQKARPSTFKTGHRVKFGETNAAPPELAFSQRLLKRAERQRGAEQPPPPQPSARERDLAEQRALVIANYRKARAGPGQMRTVPAFVPRPELDA